MCDNYLEAAFDQICKKVVEAHAHYVALMVSSPYYGGPEDGGWWGEDIFVVKYMRFDTEEAAQAALLKVQDLADELSVEARKADGDAMLLSMEWLEARGLEADFLPEPDGPDRYYVEMSQGLPQGSRGCRQCS